jgi:hypothetical protein
MLSLDDCLPCECDSDCDCDCGCDCAGACDGVGSGESLVSFLGAIFWAGGVSSVYANNVGSGADADQGNLQRAPS